MTIQEVKQGLQLWYSLIQSRDYIKILELLSEGDSFEITCNNLNILSEGSPDYIHAYPMIDPTLNKLKFVLINSTFDKEEQLTMDHLVVKEYTNGLIADASTNQNPPEQAQLKDTIAMERVFRWALYKKAWLIALESNSSLGVFQAIAIPASDFKIPLEDGANICYFGLKYVAETAEYQIEIIVSNKPNDFQLPEYYSDVSVPIPPFSASQPQSDYLLMPN